MKYDYTYLYDVIMESGIDEFANRMNQPIEHVLDLLNNVRTWTISEIDAAIEILGVSIEYIQPLFFTLAA